MKEITRIHLAKIPYEIEIYAKKRLEKYLKDLKIYSGDEDIFEDVEIRITEILAELGIKEGGVITEKEILKIEAQIGSPEVFQDLNFDGENEEIRIPKISKKLFRDEQNGMISGVAAGLAQYLRIDMVWVRLALAVMFFVSFGAIVPIYILSILIIPAAKNANDILRLRGEVITASAIREVNEEYNFEKNAARNMKIARIFGIIFGIFTVFAFLGGILAMFFGNWALMQIGEMANFANAKSAATGIIISANIMGISYLIFTAFIAKMLFKLKASKIDIIAIIVSVVVALGGILGSISFTSILRDKANEKVSKSLVSEQIKINSEKMKSVKKLKVDSSVSVFYHISDERKIEFTHMNFRKHNLKIDFEGETLKLSLNNVPQNLYFGGLGYEEIHIYGPELNEIDVTSNSNVNYFAKDAENMKVKMNGGSVYFENSAKITNLEISKGEYGVFSGKHVDVLNLTLNSNSGSVELNNVENANVKTKNCSFNSPKVTRLKARAKNVKVNNYDFNENTKGQCFYLENLDRDEF